MPQTPAVIRDDTRPAVQPQPVAPPAKKDDDDVPIIEVE
jgi:hypothetical protein